MVELWSGAAQYCLLVGNYNSSTAILEALDAPAIARLTHTVRRNELRGSLINSLKYYFSLFQWSNLVPMSQQLSCMYRHAEGYGDLWSQQTKDRPTKSYSLEPTAAKKPPTTPRSAKSKRSGEWVVIPVFKDIVRLALVAREECSQK